MKRFIYLTVAISLLALGACTTAAPPMQTRYALSQNGNITSYQYQPPANGSACTTGSINWCVAAAITAGVLVGVWGLDRVFNKPDTSEPSAPSNPLIASGGSSTSEWSTDFLVPTWTPVGD